MSTKITTFYASLVVALVLISGCGTPAATITAVTPEPASPLPTPAQQSPVSTPAADSPLPTPVAETATNETPLPASTWVADGIITTGEYDTGIELKDISLWWHHDGTWLYLALEGDTTGWVSVGINPQDGMQGANYVFGYVKDGVASIWDAYGTAPTGPNHPADEDLGGTNDIVAFAGVEEDGVTRLEVQIPLNSGDAYDQILEPGMAYPIILAIGGEDSFSSIHLNYEQSEIALSPLP